MAVISAAQTELISLLSQDDIPIKLRCAICSKLAVNAFRLPCCEQAICESCQATLPSSCPVCEHTPVSAEDCKPNKSLRTTIKVFLRTEEKKREALKPKETEKTPPKTPIDLEPAPTEAPKPVEPSNNQHVDSSAVDQVAASTETLVLKDDNSAAGGELVQEAQKDVPQPSIEESAPDPQLTESDRQSDNGVKAVEGQEADTKRDANGQSQGFGAGFGFDAMSGMNMAGMGFNGDMNQMQMMMAMQNGISPAAFGNFPMMGMPGMGMDPMMMQNMMNGGFGAGMGMNGMNMGLGMGCFEGGMNAGYNNGWNQQSWNFQPDNLNHPNAAGMGPGDRGNNSGFASHASGFNHQGNYGRNQYNDYQNNSYGYQSRGRGRGRGGYYRGRGGYGYNTHDTSSQQASHQIGAQHINGPMKHTGVVAPGAEVDAKSASHVDEFGREIRSVAEGGNAEIPDAKPNDSTSPENVVLNTGGETNLEAQAEMESTLKPIQSLDTSQQVPFAPGPSSAVHGAHSLDSISSRTEGGGPGQIPGKPSSFGSMQPPVKPVDVPINAPTGPKAMREGLPKTGFSSLRGRPVSVASHGASLTNGSINGATSEKAPSRSPSKYRYRSRSRSRDRHRDRSRHRHHRRHRHRSTSPSDDDKETERRRERRRERKRRREEEEGDEERDAISDHDEKGVRRPDRRSDSASPHASRRSSHRSSRRDSHRDTDRDCNHDDLDRKSSSSYKHRSRHRSHRPRSRSREHERERRPPTKKRHASPELDIDLDIDLDEDSPAQGYETRTPTSARTSTTVTSAAESRRHSLTEIVGRNGMEIKGASLRNKSVATEIPSFKIPTGPKGRHKDSDAKDKLSEREKGKSRSSDQVSENERHRSSNHARDHDRDKEHTRDKDRERIRDRDRDRGKDKPHFEPASTPTVDPHTLERQKRDRERLMKEAQRIAGLTGLASGAGRKRSRAEEESAGGRKKGRRERESDEERLRRLESEREEGRWA